MAGTYNRLRPSVENLRALGNWSQGFRWTVIINKLPEAIGDGFLELHFDGNKVDSDAINFRAESASLPEKEIETAEIQIRGSKVRQAGVGNYNSPFNLTLVETVDPVVLAFLGAWQEIAWYTRMGSIGMQEYKADLQTDVILQLLNNLDEPYYEFKLIGCQIATGTKGDLDASSGDPLKPQIGLAFDYFTEKALKSYNKSASTGFDE